MLPAQVRAHAKASPARIAVVEGGQRLTYAELDKKTSLITRTLRTRGIGRGSLVGIFAERTADTVAAILGILGAEAAYTIIEANDAAVAAKRMEACQPDLVLTDARYADLLSEYCLSLQLMNPAEPAGLVEEEAETLAPPAEASGNDVACIIYTSGSTGTPKGVMVSHANIEHYVTSLLTRLSITGVLAYAHVSTLEADLGNTCLFLSLWTGGTLHLIGDPIRKDPVRLLRYLQDEHVDVLKITPSHWSVLFRAYGLTADARPRLKYLLLGGELLTESLARKVMSSGVAHTLVNHYGPAEATIGVTVNVLDQLAQLDELSTGASVPIGTALGKNRLSIKTADGSYQERDAEGELYVTGPSVTLGYRHDPESTAASFQEDSLAAAAGRERSYRTGDIVRADKNGVIEYLGRRDRQVKISGYRVELRHVETSLRQLPGVCDAAVIKLDLAGRPTLAAAVTADLDDTDMRADLSTFLPAYMIPDRIFVLSEFPRNSNGKTDLTAIRTIIEQRYEDPAAEEKPSSDPIAQDITESWQQQLPHTKFSEHDNFFALGGTSLEAIQVIGDLQVKGYDISAQDFLANPTVEQLATELHGMEADPASPAERLRARTAAQDVDDSALSPAQQWFFRQNFAQPDHWNQALLLSLNHLVNIRELAETVDDLTALHPMLRTAFKVTYGKVSRESLTEAPDGLTTSVLPVSADDIAAAIWKVSNQRQKEIDIAAGKVFNAHLFVGERQAELLLICHHLVVDAVSWNIIINDISRIYGRRMMQDGEGSITLPSPIDFGAWVKHLHSNNEMLSQDFRYWEKLDAPSMIFGAAAEDLNREAAAEAIWFALSQAETKALISDERGIGAPPHAAALAAFAQSLAERHDLRKVVIDVESYGRACLSEQLDVSRVVGWFTSTFPVSISVTAEDVVATVRDSKSALDAVPHLGVSYGLYEGPQQSRICFNYLGALNFPYGDDLGFSISPYPIGPARGPDNDRKYDQKFTARIQNEQLVVDISFNPERYPASDAWQLARDSRRYLQECAGRTAQDDQLLHTTGSNTGLLGYVPGKLTSGQASYGARPYRNILLTGATGFIGTHMLHQLLKRTSARVYCLVREKSGEDIVDRLRATYSWHFSAAEFDRNRSRITVIPGDVSKSELDLSWPIYNELCENVESIYHLAGDTRLFGDQDVFDDQNTTPIHTLIKMTNTGRMKDLHYVSTLVVCGVSPGEELCTFAEDDLDIGQSFMNGYEQSKFNAEMLMRDFITDGGRGYIYRLGNVTGDSRTGRFRHHPNSDRIVQTVRAAIEVGALPHELHGGLVLSPVDVVVAGICELSLSTRTPTGTFHVDGDEEVSYQAMFDTLQELGFEFKRTDAADFGEIFGRYLPQNDPTVSLGHFWATRLNRNIRFDHSRTCDMLGELGVKFPALDQAWLRKYFLGLDLGIMTAAAAAQEG